MVLHDQHHLIMDHGKNLQRDDSLQSVRFVRQVGKFDEVDRILEEFLGQISLPNRDGGAAKPDPGAFQSKMKFAAA